MSATFKQNGPLPKANILRDGVEEVAEAAKLAMIARNTAFDVYVDQDGYLRMNRVYDNRRVHALPAEWCVGRFTRSVSMDDLEDALVVRLNEIRRTWKQPTRAAA